MKVIWEADDIKPGRQVQKPGCGITGRHMIGYRVDVDRDRNPTGYGLVSMADGLFTQYGTSGTQAELATRLNEAGYYMPVELMGLKP